MRGISNDAYPISVIIQETAVSSKVLTQPLSVPFGSKRVTLSSGREPVDNGFLIVVSPERDEEHDHGPSFRIHIWKETELIAILVPGLVDRMEQEVGQPQCEIRFS